MTQARLDQRQRKATLMRLHGFHTETFAIHRNELPVFAELVIKFELNCFRLVFVERLEQQIRCGGHFFGNVVSVHAAHLIKNFLLAVLSEGQHHDKADDVNDEAAQADMNVELAELIIAQIHRLLNAQIRSDAKRAEGYEKDTGSRQLLKAMEVTADFWELPQQHSGQARIRADFHLMYRKEDAAEHAAKNVARKRKKASSALEA